MVDGVGVLSLLKILMIVKADGMNRDSFLAMVTVVMVMIIIW